MQEVTGVDNKILFVTGTDTGIGKTFFCALLYDFFLKKGVQAGYQKWVSTGGADSSDDLQFCLEFAGVSLPQVDLDQHVPYRFEFPASPHLASEMENRRVDEDVILKQCREMASKYDVLVVEGVGGLLVPLRRDLLLADMLAGLKPLTIVVARSGLGTINHTLLTLEALRTREIPVLGVFFSDAVANEDETIVADNMRTIAEIARVPVFGRLKRCSDFSSARKSFGPIGRKIHDAFP